MWSPSDNVKSRLSWLSQKMRGRLFENFASLSVLQYANYLFPLITVPYLTRVIGVYGFGLTAFAQGFIAYFVVVVNYGFGYSATRQVAIARESRATLNRIFSNVLWAKIILGVLAFFLICLFLILSKQYRDQFNLFLSCYSIVIATVISTEWFFQGMEDMKYITVIGLISRLITTLMVFVVIRKESDYVYVPALYGLGIFVSSVVGIGMIWKKYDVAISGFDASGVWTQLKDGWDIFLSMAFISLYTTSNGFLLGLVSTPTQVGYYAAAEKIVTAIRAVWQPVPQALYPYFSRIYTDDPLRGKNLLRYLTITAFAITFALALLGCVTAPIIVHYFLGKAFHASTPIVQILVFSTVGIGISNILVLQGLLASGNSAAVRNITLGAGILNIVLVWVLGKSLGAIGASISVVSVEFIIPLVALIVLARRRLI